MTPSWLTIARKYLNVRETPGPANNPTILGWAKRLGLKVLGITYAADATPWCGLYVAHVLAEAGFTPPNIAVRASSYDGWGVAIEKRYLGAIVRFQRPGGGHVGFLVAVSADGRLLRVLGGNQSDMVCETWIEADRCVAMRWPSGIALPTILAPVLKVAGGVSANEA